MTTKQKKKTAKKQIRLQIFCPTDMVKDLDKICDGLGIYRTGFIQDLLKKSLYSEKYKHFLEGQ